MAKFHGNTLNRSENIAKRFRGAYFFDSHCIQRVFIWSLKAGFRYYILMIQLDEICIALPLTTCIHCAIMYFVFCFVRYVYIVIHKKLPFCLIVLFPTIASRNNCPINPFRRIAGIVEIWGKGKKEKVRVGLRVLRFEGRWSGCFCLNPQNCANFGWYWLERHLMQCYTLQYDTHHCCNFPPHNYEIIYFMGL